MRERSCEKFLRRRLACKGVRGNDSRLALARPQIDNPAGILRFVAIGESETARSRGIFEAQAGGVDPDNGFPGLVQGSRGGQASFLRAAQTPMRDHPARHEDDRGEKQRRFAKAPAEQSGERQNGDEGEKKRKGHKGGDMIARQPPRQRRAQACAGRGGLGVLLRQREGIGTRGRRLAFAHCSSGACVCKASA